MAANTRASRQRPDPAPAAHPCQWRAVAPANPGRGDRGSHRARLRGHHDLAGKQEERPTADVDLLALRRQGRPDRRGDRAQLPEVAGRIGAAERAEDARAQAIELGTQVAKALLDAPDFLRLGLMLALERRPVEPRAREMFLRCATDAFHRFAGIVRDIAPELDDESVRLLTTYASPAPTACSSPRRSVATRWT